MARAVWVAVLPVVLLVVTLLATIVEGGRNWWIAPVLAMWILNGVVGLVLFVPPMVITLVGARVVPRKFRRGRGLLSFGSAVTTIVAAAFVVGALVESIAPSERLDPNSWTVTLTPLETVVYVGPYVVMVVANGLVLAGLWKRSAPLRAVAARNVE